MKSGVRKVLIYRSAVHRNFSEGDVWVGSWTPPPGKRLIYKYVVSDGVDRTDDGYEWLGCTTYGAAINRYVDIPSK